MKNKVGALSCTEVFGQDSIDPRYLFIHSYGDFPNISTIYEIDMRKTMDIIKERYTGKRISIYYNSDFKRKKKEYEYSEVTVDLHNGIVINIEDNIARIFHKSTLWEEVVALSKMIGATKARVKRKTVPREMCVLVHGQCGLYFKMVEIGKISLNVGLFYDDDFAKVDQKVRERLNNSKDKGVVLLHGLPGTGKTTYLRFLISKLKKKVIFIPGTLASRITDPDFLNLLMSYKESVIIIEDAENVIMDRSINPHGGVTALLNLTDGLMSDFLGIQVICTFNKALTLVDDALMRQGRLIARYEFGKLSVKKAQTLSDHLGFNSLITQPLTVAEIANQNDVKQTNSTARILGFGKMLVDQE